MIMIMIMTIIIIITFIRRKFHKKFNVKDGED